MKFKNILTKPYKYQYFYTTNKYTKISNTFSNINNNYFKFINIFNINKKQIQKFSNKFSNNIYKSFLILKFFKLRVDIKLIQLGIMKTLKQARHLITYGKILINGHLNKNPNLKLKIGDCIQIIPILYLENLQVNFAILKQYLFNFNNLTRISQKNILNINKYIFYIRL